MSGKKGKFTAKAQSVLGVNRPSDMKDFLTGGSSQTAEALSDTTSASVEGDRETLVDEVEFVRKSDNPEFRNDGARALESTPLADAPTSAAANPNAGKTEREEFRFTPELSDRLRRYCYERRTKKTRVVTRALEDFLEREGY